MKSEIAEFVSTSKLPLVTIFTRESASSIFESLIKKQVRLFFQHGCLMLSLEYNFCCFFLSALSGAMMKNWKYSSAAIAVCGIKRFREVSSDISGSCKNVQGKGESRTEFGFKYVFVDSRYFVMLY